MFHELVDDPGDRSPEEVYGSYLEVLIDVIEEQGIDEIASEADVDPETLRTLSDGGDPDLTLSEAASVLAIPEENPSADEIEAVSREALLMGMSLAVLDVEAIASGLDNEIEPREIQSKAEGRFPMPLREYALLHQYIEAQKR